jgi:ribonuclease HI
MYLCRKCFAELLRVSLLVATHSLTSSSSVHPLKDALGALQVRRAQKSSLKAPWTHSTHSRNAEFITREAWRPLKHVLSLSPNLSITFQWSPGHLDSEGNEAADALAKRGAELGIE